MAKPKTENGYVRIANELMDYLCKLNLSGPEFMILLAVIRNTFGLNKKVNEISLTHFQNLTLMTKTRIIRAIKSLMQRKILGSDKGCSSQRSTYWIMKDYKKMTGSITHDTTPSITGDTSITHDTSLLYKSITDSSFTPLGSITHDTTPSITHDTSLLHNSITDINTQQTQPMTEQSKEQGRASLRCTSASRDFDALWMQYPRRVGKKNAVRHFKASVKTDEDYEDIKKALNNYLLSETVNNGFIQNGSTWFNNWRDYVDVAGVAGKSQALVELEEMMQ